MEDLWSSGRRVHSFTERTPACFDVAERGSRLETDHRVYVTPGHLVSLRMGGEVDGKEG